MELMVTAQYLMYSPGVQHLLMWGGQQAQDTVRAIAGLEVNRPRLHEVAQVWHAAAAKVGSVVDTLGAAHAQTGDWSGAAAEQFREEYRRHVDHYTELAHAYRTVGDTVSQTADAMGEAHDALVAVTLAAGRGIATLAPDLSAETSSGAAAVIVNSWRAVSEQVIAHCGSLAGSVAAAMNASPGTPAAAR